MLLLGCDVTKIVITAAIGSSGTRLCGLLGGQQHGEGCLGTGC